MEWSSFYLYIAKFPQSNTLPCDAKHDITNSSNISSSGRSYSNHAGLNGEQLSKTNLYIRGLRPDMNDKDLVALCQPWVLFFMLQGRVCSFVQIRWPKQFQTMQRETFKDFMKTLEIWILKFIIMNHMTWIIIFFFLCFIVIIFNYISTVVIIIIIVPEKTRIPQDRLCYWSIRGNERNSSSNFSKPFLIFFIIFK